MLILLVTAALVIATALVVARRAAERGVTQWLLAAYILGFSEIVLVSLGLSLFDAFSRWPLVITLVALFALAVISARAPAYPDVRLAGARTVEALREPPLAIIAALAAGVVAYSLALGLFRPPNDEDALAYHLARAAFWHQQHAVDYIPHAADGRLDQFAPNGEIAMAFTMVSSGTGRFAPLVQLVAALACGLAVYGIALRVGLRRREGLLSGLLFFTAPVVALQASTALNDIIVASLVATACFFLLGETHRNLIVGGLALALVVGTKLTGLLALPGLALIAILAHRQRTRLLVATFATAVCVGAYWYIANLVRGEPAMGGIGGERTRADALAAISRVVRLLLDAVELPGAVGLDKVLYVVAAAVVAAIVLRRHGVLWAALAAAATVTPLLLVPVDHLAVRASQKVFFELGRGDVGYLDSKRSATKASPIFSWYGPLGVMLTLFACAVAVRRRLPIFVLAVAAAPFLWTILLGVGVPYWEWNGRYVMGGFAVGAAMWGIVGRVRPLMWPVAAIALLATTLAFVRQHDRSSGLRMLEPATEQSVWTQPDWQVEATDHPHLRALYRFAKAEIPRHARIALQSEVFPGGKDIGGNLPPFAFFGASLSHTVLFADNARAARRAGAEWAVLREPGSALCGWKHSLRYDVWVVLKRDPAARCA